MSSPSPVAVPMQASSAEQIYFTHCASGDGAGEEDGYGVRATSTSDAAALAFALSLPAHEIPVDAWGLGLLPHQAPRRLALLLLPDGRRALVHSAYLREDTRGRPRSFFTHVLIYPRLSLIDAARSWASPDWRTNYPAGAPQSLEPMAGLPSPGPLNDDALAEFLSARSMPSADQTLGGVTFPRRWENDQPARHRLARQALAGVLRMLNEGGDRRLFVLAEPGVVALLTYAVARLLPPQLTGELTFSTYESPDGSLWDRSAAKIVGAWNASEAPLNAEQLQRHGYGIDAFRGTQALEVPPIVDVLLKLAAERQWSKLAWKHALWTRDEHLSAANLGDVITVEPAYDRVLDGQTTREDLLTLAGSSLGQALSREQEATLWPLVRGHSAKDDAIRTAYVPMLQRHRAELDANLLESLGEGDPNGWLRRWAVVRSLLPEAGRLTFFLSLLEGGAKFSFDWRLALLREWRSLSPDGPVPRRHAHLVTPADERELTALRGAGLPVAWVAQALWLALPGQAMAVLRALQAGGKELLRAFCSAVPSDDPPIEDRLGSMMPRDDPASCRRFATFLGAGLALDADRLERVLANSGADAPGWCAELWRQGDALARISRTLSPGSAMLAKVWVGCCAAIDRRLLAGDEGQLETLKFLRACQKSVEGAIPPAAAQTLTDWATLHQQLHKPGDPEKASGAALEEACRRRGVGSRAELVTATFGPLFTEAEAVPAKTLQRVIRSVVGYFHPDEDAAFAVLLDLAARATEERQEAYHQAFMEGVSESSRAALVVRHRARLRLSRETTSKLLQPTRWGWVAALVGAAFVAGVGCGLFLGWLAFSR